MLQPAAALCGVDFTYCNTIITNASGSWCLYRLPQGGASVGAVDDSTYFFKQWEGQTLSGWTARIEC
jgi:hypothetical protein